MLLLISAVLLGGQDPVPKEALASIKKTEAGVSAVKAEGAIEGPGVKDPKALIDVGDLWLEAAKKNPRHAPLIKDRAIYWYGEAWLRQTQEERGPLRRLFMAVSPPPANLQKPLGGQPSGWHPFGGAWKTSVDPAMAHAGRSSAKLLPTSDAATNGFSAVQSLPAQAVEGREYVLSAFVYSYDTDVAGEVELRFFDAAGKGIKGFVAPILVDCPFWRRVEVKAQAPAGAVSVAVDCRAKFTRGATWIDDVSVTLDGRETLLNGSFEKR